MSTFGEREKGYENKFAHDQEKEFRARSKRNKLLGRWAASKMRLSEEDVEHYALKVVDHAIIHGTDEAIMAKVIGDLREKGIDVAEADVQMEMERLLSVARETLK